jgi:hypothetical protein
MELSGFLADFLDLDLVYERASSSSINGSSSIGGAIIGGASSIGSC